MTKGIAKYANWRLKLLILAGDPPPWLVKTPRRAYITKAILATPAGVCPRDFNRLVRLRDERTRIYGTQYVLAHIEPLGGEYVCGLNAPWNIKIVPWRVNARESNHRLNGQQPLFIEHAQIPLFPAGAIDPYS